MKSISRCGLRVATGIIKIPGIVRAKAGLSKKDRSRIRKGMEPVGEFKPEGRGTRGFISFSLGKGIIHQTKIIQGPTSVACPKCREGRY